MFGIGKVIDKKVDKIYSSYKKKQLKRIDAQLSAQIAKEKALETKLVPVRKKIADLKEEKRKIQESFK